MFEYTAEIINVVDGDTIDLIIDLGFNIKNKTRVKLSRINTPEIYWAAKDSVEYQKGIASMKFVQDFAKMTNNKIRVFTIKNKTEKYGRYLVEIYALEGPFKDKNLNDEMLTFGFASEYNQ